MGGLLWALFIGLGGLPYSQLIQILGSGTRTALWLAFAQAVAAVIQTVTGNAPLTLANAVSRAIKSLVQYGLCTQSTAPTPSAPVDIMCNNGALRMVDDELPSGYKRITGIKFDGDFYYNTNEALTGDDDVTMTLADTVTTGQNVFGSYNGTASGTKNFSLFIYGAGSSTGSYLRYGEQLLRPKFGSNERTITFGKSGTSGFATDATATPETFTTPANAYIGMLPNSTSPEYTGTIVGNITVGTRLKWIPCERVSDGAIGYYEAVNGNFLAPTGTGTPTKGAYDYTHAHLEVVGTPEVLTIGADGVTPQTVTGISDLLSVKYSYLSSGTAVDEQDIVSGKVTRRCGVKVLDGTEEWTRITPTGGKMQMYIPVPEDAVKSNGTYIFMCSHFQSGYNQQYVAISTEGYCSYRIISFQNINRMTFTPVDQTMTKDDWTAWVAEQYAAGTPIIVVYPLATPTTEQTTPHALTTTEGTNTVSVTSNVSPTQLSVEYAASE